MPGSSYSSLPCSSSGMKQQAYFMSAGLVWKVEKCVLKVGRWRIDSAEPRLIRICFYIADSRVRITQLCELWRSSYKVEILPQFENTRIHCIFAFANKKHAKEKHSGPLCHSKPLGRERQRYDWAKVPGNRHSRDFMQDILFLFCTPSLGQESISRGAWLCFRVNFHKSWHFFVGGKINSHAIYHLHLRSSGWQIWLRTVNRIVTKRFQAANVNMWQK